MGETNVYVALAPSASRVATKHRVLVRSHTRNPLGASPPPLGSGTSRRPSTERPVRTVVGLDVPSDPSRNSSATALSAQCLAHRVTGLLVPSALIEAQRPLALQTARQRGGLTPFTAGDAFHVVQEQLPVSFGPCPLRHHKIVEVEVAPVVEVYVDGRARHGNEFSGL